MTGKIFRTVVLFTFVCVGAFAQAIRFDIEMDHSSFVVGEHVTCKIKIGNLGTKPLVIDDFSVFRQNRIFFEIFSKPNELYSQCRPGKIIKEMDLGHNEAVAFDVDLSEWYRLLDPAHLFIRAVLVCNEMRYESPLKTFDIVPGIEMASVEQFIPGAPSITRKISLVYWNRQGRELAFLRASDSPSGIIWMSLFLGDVVRVRKPSIIQDAKNPNVFSVYRQATRDMLVRTIFNSDEKGIRIVKQTRAVETVSSPMVDSIREAVENAPDKD